jgi:hypothetical protein
MSQRQGLVCAGTWFKAGGELAQGFRRWRVCVAADHPSAMDSVMRQLNLICR